MVRRRISNKTCPFRRLFRTTSARFTAQYFVIHLRVDVPRQPEDEDLFSSHLFCILGYFHQSQLGSIDSKRPQRSCKRMQRACTRCTYMKRSDVYICVTFAFFYVMVFTFVSLSTTAGRRNVHDAVR